MVVRQSVSAGHHPTSRLKGPAFRLASPDAPPHWRPVIKRVVPVVRWAILVRHTPRLTSEHPGRVLSAFEQTWSDWASKYRASVAAQAGIELSDLRIVPHESIRLRLDGKTPMLDLPRVQTARGVARKLDLRNCVALCLDDLSSKIWTRIGIPYDDAIVGSSTSELRSAIGSFRAIARSCCEWFYKEFLELTSGAFDGIESKRVGILEVTTVGLSVDQDDGDEDFDSWLLEGSKGPNLQNEDLCTFLADAANLDFHPREMTRREPDSFWMSLPGAVQLPTGDLASRRILYLVRPIDGVVQIVGIGLDDSQSSDLASHVALKISRLVANRI
jgi:hypothetical protein